MIKLILIILPLILLPSCARKTGSIQIGNSEPAFQLNGDNLSLNPQILGVADMPAINLDAYSDGSIDMDIGTRHKQPEPSKGKAW